MNQDEGRTAVDIEAAIKFVGRELVRDPLGLGSDGTPRAMHYVVIREALAELQERRNGTWK